MSYPKRRAAAIAEELTKQELALAEDQDDDEEEDDGNFTAVDAETKEAEAEKKGPKRKRGPAGLALSDDEDDEGDGSGGAAATARGGAAAARGGAAAARSGGAPVLNSLDALKDAAKRRKTDALFEELNGGGPKPAARPAGAAASALGVPAKGAKLKCLMRAQVRAGPAMASAASGELKIGEMVEILETQVLETGTVRCRFARGWVSMKTGAGTAILQRVAAPANMFPGGARQAAGSSGLSIAELAKKLALKGTATETPAAAAGGVGAAAPAPARKNKMNDILQGLKKGQISTTAKSRGDWDHYKKEAGAYFPRFTLRFPCIFLPFLRFHDHYLKFSANSGRSAVCNRYRR